jgi:hypothetical protein
MRCGNAFFRTVIEARLQVERCDTDTGDLRRGVRRWREATVRCIEKHIGKLDAVLLAEQAASWEEMEPVPCS